MASITSLSAAEIQNSFSENAIFYMEDAAVGRQVKEMHEMGFPIASVTGLDFCQKNVLEDESLLPWAGLGIYEVYRADSNNVYAFMTGLKREMKAVVVQLWSPQSSMTVYKGSHLLPIRGFNASNGLLEIPHAPLKECKHEQVLLGAGGLAILDARLAFKTQEGFAIHFVFGTREEIASWAKRKFPRQEELMRKAEEMTSATIGLNFVFQKISP